MSYFPTGQSPFEGKALSLMQRRIALEEKQLAYQKDQARWEMISGLAIVAIPLTAIFGFPKLTKILGS